ncbi:hypothetical protein IL306_012460, partial [Fusarium sp. DS 682]
MTPDRPANESGSGSDNDKDNQSVANDSSTMATKDDFKVDLLKAIKGINTVSKFSFNEEVEIPEDFSISVDGAGRISLPLKRGQVQKIITQARQAPFGKGSDTIIDTSVRKTWELDPEQFTIGGEEWSNHLKEICELVAQKMGINTPVHAELYKMLLYEKGAMFKAHTDTEKIPGMFGTLVISLPSKHKGGEVVLKHYGEEMTYESAKYNASCAAWYSDIYHKVLPVKSGYRWVLTYNLAIDQSLPRPSAAFPESDLQPLRDCVEVWLAQEQGSRKTPYACHVLDHEYTEANISCKLLKGTDMAYFMAVQQALEGLPVTMFLALLEKKEEGAIDFLSSDTHAVYDWYTNIANRRKPFKGSHPPLLWVEDTFCQLKTIRDLQGEVVADELFITENVILNPSALGVTVENEYEFTGNYGVTATHWYRRGTIVIVPHDSVAGLLSEIGIFRGSFPEMQIKYFVHLCSQPGVQDHLVNTMVGLVEEAMPGLELDRDLLKDKTVLPNVVRISLQQKRYQIVEDILAKFSELLPSDFFTWVRQWMSEPDDEEKTLEKFNNIKKG